MTDRFVVLGLAEARAPWFARIAAMATSAALPIEFIKCMSREELRIRLGSGRAFSALIVGAGVHGIDRDLFASAASANCPVVVVTDNRVVRDWQELGASASLPPDLTREDVLDALRRHAAVIGRADRAPLANATTAESEGAFHGSLLCVTGTPGAGASTIAMALAQGLAADPSNAAMVCLADLALHADQAMMHDVGDIVPGIQELVEAYRSSRPSASDIRDLTFYLPERKYHVLLGLRRHRDWAAIRPRAGGAALEGLVRCFRYVVADTTADFEGESQVGSHDIEDRNLFSRHCATNGHLVVAVGVASLAGMHRLVRHIGDLHELGVTPQAIVPIINHAPKGAKAKADLASALSELTSVTPSVRDAAIPYGVATPIFIGHHRKVGSAVRHSHPLPTDFARSVTSPLVALANSLEDHLGDDSNEPTAITPGSLGAWELAQ